MQFVRKLTLIYAKGFIIAAAHVPGHQNSAADALSHFQPQDFKQPMPDADTLLTPVPLFSATVCYVLD